MADDGAPAGSVFITPREVYDSVQGLTRAVERLQEAVGALQAPQGRLTPPVAWAALCTAVADVVWRSVSGG